VSRSEPAHVRLDSTQYNSVRGNTIKRSIPTRLGDAYVPHTLSVLYNATSRGLAHKPTRNLRGFSHHRGDWLRSAYERHSIPWRLTGDPVHIKLRKRQTDGNEPGELVWNMVGKVRMAEGRDQPILGGAPSCQRRSFRNLRWAGPSGLIWFDLARPSAHVTQDLVAVWSQTEIVYATLCLSRCGGCADFVAHPAILEKTIVCSRRLKHRSRSSSDMNNTSCKQLPYVQRRMLGRAVFRPATVLVRTNHITRPATRRAIVRGHRFNHQGKL